MHAGRARGGDFGGVRVEILKGVGGWGSMCSAASARRSAPGQREPVQCVPEVMSEPMATLEKAAFLCEGRHPSNYNRTSVF
jgi:hypothetical protein